MLFKSSRLFWKYFISYLFVLIIPLITIGAFVFNYFSTYLVEGTINTNRNMLTQVKNIVDGRLNELQNIAFQISANPDLAPYVLKDNVYQKMRGVTALKNYLSTNGFISDLLFYVRGDDYIYSPSSTYSVTRFMQSKYAYPDWKNDAFVEALQSSDSPVVRPSEDVVVSLSDRSVKTERMMTFLMPIPVYSSSPYGSLLILVKESALRNLIRDTFDSYEGNSIIFDKSGQVITALNQDEFLQNGRYVQLLSAHKGDASEKIELNGKEYLLSIVKSERNSWSYVTLVPTEALMREVTDLKLKTLLGLLIVLLIGSGATFYFSMKHYNPIKQLKEFAENKSGKKIGNINEIEIVRQVIDNISVENANLSNQVMSSKDAMKDYLLFKLIKGQIYDMDEFNSLGETLNLRFTKSSFMVAVFYLHMTEKILNYRNERMVAFLEEKLPGDVEGYAKESMDHNVVVLLLAAEPENQGRVEEQVRLLKQSINERWSIHVTVGMGSPYEDLSMIGKSYLEAMTALHYRFIAGNNRVIRFPDINDKAIEIAAYPKHELEQLNTAIKRENIEWISEIIRRIGFIIRKEHVSIFVARSLCYDVINTVIKTVVEMNDNQLIGMDDYPDVVTLMKFDTVEELEHEVLKVCEHICSMIRKKEQRQDSLIRKLENYVDDHYRDPDFSVTAAAESLGITSSYLSRYFKEQTGTTISEHVNVKRMKEAEQLLKGSAEPIQSIVYKVGYYDLSSFIRKFKSSTGFTPGDYRKMHKS